MNLFAGQERDTDTEKGFAGGGEGVRTERATMTHTHYHVENRWLVEGCYGTRGVHTGSSAWYSDTLRGEVGRGRQAQDGGNIYICVCVCVCIIMADLHCCTAETNTTL